MAAVLLTVVAVALPVLVAYATVARSFGPAGPVIARKALTGLGPPDPTASSLPAYTDAVAVAEDDARAALRDDGDATGERYAQGLAALAVGHVVGPETACTATMVESPSGRVAVTAAHCVYLVAIRPTGEVDELRSAYDRLDVFVPGRPGDRADWGQFSVEGAWIDPVWRETGDLRYDVAFLRLSTTFDRTPQSVVGAEPIAFDRAVGRPATVVGYPDLAPTEGGNDLRRCSTPATGVNPSAYTLELRCRIHAGSSGGPWLTDFDDQTGRGTVMAVSSYREDDVVGGARLGRVAHRLYVEADTDAPHR